jgi:hypothetical protein
MLNISKDNTGKSAGSWINPIENSSKIKAKLYRVRTSKSNKKSQKGAFSSLLNAKNCCQAAGANYKIFDWNYNIVYYNEDN